MTQKKSIAEKNLCWKEALLEDPEFLKTIVEEVLQQVLEGEMDQTLQAGKGERTPFRLGYRSGYYQRTLVTRVGKLELRVPQDRKGRFSTQLFDGSAVLEFGRDVRAGCFDAQGQEGD